MDLDAVVSARELDARIGAGAKVELREYFEALIAQQAKAIEVAERERVHAAATLRQETAAAATVLRDEMHRAQDIAERERGKVSAEQGERLTQLIRDGDERLRDHIAAQVIQINVAVGSTEAIAVERHAAMHAELRAIRDELLTRMIASEDRMREHVQAQVGQIASALESARRETDAATGAQAKALDLATQAQAKALEKAETATDKRFDAVTEFRLQLTAQTATLMPREVAEAQLAELRRSITELTEKLGKIA